MVVIACGISLLAVLVSVLAVVRVAAVHRAIVRIEARLSAGIPVREVPAAGMAEPVRLEAVISEPEFGDPRLAREARWALNLEDPEARADAIEAMREREALLG